MSLADGASQTFYCMSGRNIKLLDPNVSEHKTFSLTKEERASVLIIVDFGSIWISANVLCKVFFIKR